MTELICIVCPKGCHLKVDENNDFAVTGHSCQKGEVYGKKELTNPTRVLTSTVRIQGATLSRLPVKTDHDIPKGEITNAMKLLNDVTLQAPVQIGDIVIKNILGLGVNFVATKSMDKE
ncbi:MAG: DUF1667 domain-containing protein [Oscillospiraceae bacterium]